MMLSLKIKHVLILVLLSSLTLFMSCVSEGDNNVVTISGVPSYVISAEGADVKLQTLSDYSPLSVPKLDTVVQQGDFGIISFSIDFGKNNAQTGYTADLYQWLPALEFAVESKTGDMRDTYNDTISSVEMYSQTLLNNHIFMLIRVGNTIKNQKYDYELIWNKDSTSSTPKYENMPAMYLKSKVIPEKHDTVNYSYRAIDMSLFMKESTLKDSTINKVKYDWAQFNLYYQTSTNKDGVPVYKAATNNPQIIFERKIIQ